MLRLLSEVVYSDLRELCDDALVVMFGVGYGGDVYRLQCL
jgi:hypothetical protein